MALITDATLAKVKNEVAARNELIRQFVRLYAASTWDAIQLDVKTMTLADLAVKYPVGTELVTTYTYNDVAYDMPWVVVAHRKVVKEDGFEHNGMVIQSKYATIEDIQFDAPEQEEATETNALEGWYYCGRAGNTYTMLDLNTGDTVPYGDYEHIYHGSVNAAGVYQYGYNRYLYSGKRQWLNSAAPHGEWWTSQHPGDVAPSQLSSRDGFMAGLPDDFLAVIDPVQIKVAANTVTDGGVTDVMYDRFFLPSLEEIYAVPQAAGVEGEYWPYWKTITGLDDPSNAVNDARITPRINNPAGATASLRCRSAYRGGTYYVWSVYPSGSLYYSNAINSYAAQPACVIS